MSAPYNVTENSYTILPPMSNDYRMIIAGYINSNDMRGFSYAGQHLTIWSLGTCHIKRSQGASIFADERTRFPNQMSEPKGQWMLTSKLSRPQEYIFFAIRKLPRLSLSLMAWNVYFTDRKMQSKMCYHLWISVNMHSSETKRLCYTKSEIIDRSLYRI
jgi:hypothetical protein